MTTTFKQHYESVIRSELAVKGKYKNVHSIPRLEKIVLNMGLGRKLQEKAVLESATNALADISGQRPCVMMAKLSVAAFKIREGMPIGLKVTLRGNRMYEFLQRLIVIAMPRIRDFRGVSFKSFDGHGNFSFGIKEYHIFPEIKYDKVSDILGMDVTIVTSAETNKEGRLLLEAFGIPFKD